MIVECKFENVLRNVHCTSQSLSFFFTAHEKKDKLQLLNFKVKIRVFHIVLSSATSKKSKSIQECRLFGDAQNNEFIIRVIT